MNILVIDKIDTSLKEKLIRHNCTITESLSESKEQILQNFNFDGLILRSRFSIDHGFIKKAKSLKFIARFGSGMENIDTQTALKYNIKCISSPEGNRDAVAEHTIGLILCLLNKINLANNQINNGLWIREENKGIELMGKTIGIIGYGNTGKALCDKLIGFNCNIITYDKYRKNYGNKFIQEVSMKEIFKFSDILSLHIPLSNETKSMINSSFLSKFKKPLFIINTSRGSIINTNDLISCLKTKSVLGACLDVLEYEETSFEKLTKKNTQIDFLKKANNVILTPHIAGWTFESTKKMSVVLTKKILAYIKSIS